MSDSNKERLKLLKLLKKQNQLIVMHRIYRLGFDILSSYMMCKTSKDIEDYHDVTDIEIERISNLIDNTIIKNYYTIELLKNNPAFDLKDIHEATKIQQKKIDAITVKKDYKNISRFMDKYISKGYDRIFLRQDLGDDDEDSFIEDFLK